MLEAVLVLVLGQMWSGNNSSESYAPTGLSSFGGFCNTICSCLSLLCCCWVCQNCLGRLRGSQQGPTTPLIDPPPGPMDDHLGQLGGPHSPFEVSNPPGPPGLVLLEGPHSPFGVSNTPGPPPGLIGDRHGHPKDPHHPFQVSVPPGPPGPPRLSIQHGSLVHHGPPRPYESPGVPEHPRVPSIQPGLL